MHGLIQKAMSFHDVEIASIKGNDYSIFIIWCISKDRDINLLKKNNLTEKVEYYKIKNGLTKVMMILKLKNKNFTVTKIQF